MGAQRRPDTTSHWTPASPFDLRLGRSPDALSLSPIPFNSGKMETHYLFCSRSGERESSFLGPVRVCSALQTTSLRPMSVSRGSKPCREGDRDDQAGRRRRAPSGPSWLCPFESPEQGRPARLSGLLDRRITSVPSPQLPLGVKSPPLPSHPHRGHSSFLPQTELRWPGRGVGGGASLSLPLASYQQGLREVRQLVPQQSSQGAENDDGQTEQQHSRRPLGNQLGIAGKEEEKPLELALGVVAGRGELRSHQEAVVGPDLAPT